MEDGKPNLISYEGASRRQQNILQRLEALENGMNRMAMDMQNIADVLQCATDVLGPDVVQKAYEALRKQRNKQVSDAQAQRIEKEIGEGKLSKADTIDTTSIVVGHELDKDGKVFAERVQLHYNQFIPKFRETIMDKPVGFEFKSENGGTFIVDEIYRVNLIQRPVEDKQ